MWRVLPEGYAEYPSWRQNKCATCNKRVQLWFPEQTGWQITGTAPNTKFVSLVLDENTDVFADTGCENNEAEAYSVVADVDSSSVVVTAKTNAGVFYGIQVCSYHRDGEDRSAAPSLPDDGQLQQKWDGELKLYRVYIHCVTVEALRQLKFSFLDPIQPCQGFAEIMSYNQSADKIYFFFSDLSQSSGFESRQEFLLRKHR